MNSPVNANKLPSNGPDVSSGEIRPCNHIVQFYTDDTTFLDCLACHIAEGINAGDSVIVIATAAHRLSLEFRLRALGFNIPVFVRDDRYIAIDAGEMLSKFVVNGCPDERLFRKLVSALLARAQKNGRHVRAFGEMVALLWEKGNKSATFRLESFWDDFCRSELFSLYCAYPCSGFAKDAEAALKQISAVHSHVITAIPPQALSQSASHAIV